MYFGFYTCISNFIHVLQSIYLSYRTYIGLTELILVLRNLYWYFGSYTCVTELIHVFQILHVYYGTYIYLTELIQVLGILFLCKGTRRYDESEQVMIISHTRSDQTYTDTDISLS